MAESGGDGEGEGDAVELELTLDDFGRVAGVQGKPLNYKPRSFPGAIHFDSAQRTKVLDDCTATFTARSTEGDEEYSEGETFFIPADKRPCCSLERLALSIFEFHTAGAEFDLAKSGAEWWTQVINVDDDIGFHFDRDYEVEESCGINVHPHLATVTYLSEHNGAPTVVLQHPGKIYASEQPLGEVGEAYLSYPSEGKHLSFDGRLLHAAPSDLVCAIEGKEGTEQGTAKQNGKRKRIQDTENAGGSAEMSSKGGKGEACKNKKRPRKRVTFLVNVWLNHVPVSAVRCPDRISSLLSDFKPEVRLASSSEKGSSINVGEAEPHELVVNQDAHPLKVMKWKFGTGESTLGVTMQLPTEQIREARQQGNDLLRLQFTKDCVVKVEPAEPDSSSSEGSSEESSAEEDVDGGSS
jgi:hypothetical protein